MRASIPTRTSLASAVLGGLVVLGLLTILTGVALHLPVGSQEGRAVQNPLALAASCLALGTVLFVLPGATIVGALCRPASLLRFCITSLLTNIAFCLFASVALKLVFGTQWVTPFLTVWTAATAGFTAAAAMRLSRWRLHNDLSGAILPVVVGCAAIMAFVWTGHRLDQIDDDRYLTDDVYGRLARIDHVKQDDCSVLVVSADGACLSDDSEFITLPPEGILVRVKNRAETEKRVSLCFLVCNRMNVECDARLVQSATVIAHEPLLAVYDRNRHSRNYHKLRSNCGTIGTTVSVRPGEATYRLELRPRRAQETWRAECASLSNLDARRLMRRVERLAFICGLADIRESFDLSMSMTEHLVTHTVDYDEADIEGGGHTSVEPPLHHLWGAMALATLGHSVGSLAALNVVVLVLTYAFCVFAVRRTAGRVSWLSAGILACLFMAYTTFVRPWAEGTEPDTSFMLLFVIGLILLIDTPGARSDKWLWLGTVALASFTQYYAAPFMCLCLLSYLLSRQTVAGDCPSWTVPTKCVSLGTVREGQSPSPASPQSPGSQSLHLDWRRVAWGWLSCVAVALAVMLSRATMALATGSSAALWADLKDQNLSRYFGLCLELVRDGRLWLLPYIAANYAHFLLAVLAASLFLPFFLPWLRNRASIFFSLSALMLFLFIGVAGFQRSHYIAPIAPLLGIAWATGYEAEKRPRRRAWLGPLGVVATCLGLVVCLTVGRDYTGVFSPVSFWGRSGNVERARYFIAKGMTALEDGALQEAEGRFFKAVLAEPMGRNRGIAYAALAQAHLHTGQIGKALNLAQRATESDPQSGQAYAALASVLTTVGDHRGAMAALRQGLAVDTTSVDLNMQMAIGLAQQGKTPPAIRHVQRVLAEDPENAEAKTFLQRLRALPADH